MEKNPWEEEHGEMLELAYLQVKDGVCNGQAKVG